MMTYIIVLGWVLENIILATLTVLAVVALWVLILDYLGVDLTSEQEIKAYELEQLAIKEESEIH